MLHISITTQKRPATKQMSWPSVNSSISCKELTVSIMYSQDNSKQQDLPIQIPSLRESVLRDIENDLVEIYSGRKSKKAIKWYNSWFANSMPCDTIPYIMPFHVQLKSPLWHIALTRMDRSKRGRNQLYYLSEQLNRWIQFPYYYILWCVALAADLTICIIWYAKLFTSIL